MIKPSLRLRPRVYIPLIILLPFVALGIYAHSWCRAFSELPGNWKHNIALHYTPEQLRPYVRPLIDAPDPGGPPPFFPEVFNAPWPGSFALPQLSTPTYKSHIGQHGVVQTLQSPAFLMLHIFSTSRRSSRLRRELIREYNLLQAIPVAYRHLVEVKFVLGLPRTMDAEEAATEEGKDLLKEYEEEELEIQNEIGKYGDMIRLDMLMGGENMNNGKSMEWMRWVGREGSARKAQWVFKCDDDTFPILPNLLDYLIKQDPAKPSYVGSSIGHWTGFQYYFDGLMYGFSWGVIKTIASAALPKSFVENWQHEDARMGEIMCNLPSIPLCHPSTGSFSTEEHGKRALTSRIVGSPLARQAATSEYHRRKEDQCVEHEVPFLTPPPSGWGGTPLSPDPRSGLMRLDLGPRLGNWEAWAIEKNSRSVGWHNLKSDSDYVAAYYRAHRLFEQSGKAYLWKPPAGFVAFAEP